MGICGSANLSAEDKSAKDTDKKLHQQMAAHYQLELTKHKLLLLGAGESGKSTLFKQMICIYGKGYDEETRRTFCTIIKSNVISCARTLSKQSAMVGFKECETKDGQSAKVYIDDLKVDNEISPECAKHLQALWADPGIQATYDLRAQYQLTDSCAYFFEALDRISQEAYVPSEQDVMRSRVRTTGIVENAFDIDGNKFKMFDVGGQRNERKKWIHCFEGVTAVLFVAAISAYDQKLYEDENCNRMLEALKLFQEICESRWFASTSIILFLNKKDIFIAKLHQVPLSVCFDGGDLPLYTGDNSEADATQFIVDEFMRRNTKTDKQIYFHVTTATDKENTRKIFNAVKDIIIKESLRQAGLLE